MIRLIVCVAILLLWFFAWSYSIKRVHHLYIAIGNLVVAIGMASSINGLIDIPLPEIVRYFVIMINIASGVSNWLIFITAPGCASCDRLISSDRIALAKFCPHCGQAGPFTAPG